MGYQPKGKMKMSTKPPAPIPPQTSRLARINDMSEEDYIKTEKVVEVCNQVTRITQREDLSLGDVIIWLSDKNDELAKSLQKSAGIEAERVGALKHKVENLEEENNVLRRNASAQKLMALEDKIDNLYCENVKLKNEIALLKAREKYEIQKWR